MIQSLVLWCYQTLNLILRGWLARLMIAHENFKGHIFVDKKNFYAFAWPLKKILWLPKP